MAGPTHVRRLLFAAFALAGIAGFTGLVAALVTATRDRHAHLGIIGPGLGSHFDLARLTRLGGLPVDSVTTPALAAGIQPGDVVTHIDGRRPITAPELWYRLRFSLRPGDEVTFAVRRGGESRTVPLHAAALAAPLRWPVGPPELGAPWVDYRLYPWWIWGPTLLMVAPMLVVGILLGMMRLHDDAAWRLARMFLGIALGVCISTGTPLLHLWPAWAVVAGALAAAFGIAMSVPAALDGLAGFPQPSRVGHLYLRWRGIYYALFTVTGLVLALAVLAPWLGSGALDAWLGAGWVDRIFSVTMTAGFLTMAVLLIAQRFEPASLSRGRLALVEFGVLSAVAGGLLGIVLSEEAWFRLFAPLGVAGGWIASIGDELLPALLVIMLPIAFAHAILARRLFGIRFVVRRGLQHLLLSRGVLAVEGLVLFLALDQAFRHGFRPGGQGAALAGVTALAVLGVLSLINRPLMQAIDRRFFRDRYDARRVLLGLGENLARLRDRGELLRRAGEAIRTALHPARIAFLSRAPGGALEPAWSAGGAPDRDDVARLTGLLETADGDRVRHLPRVPHAATPGFAAPAGDAPAPFELLVPLRRGREVAGALALAAKLSEEPYDGEDRELLLTVAHQLGLALENAELLEVARREARLARDVEIARQVQENLFPKTLPEAPGWQIAAVCRPARSVAGDYYDLFRDGDGAIAFALGDVSGKGVGASLLSAGVHATVRSRMRRHGEDLAVLVRGLNAQLLDSTASGMFLTLFIGWLDPARATVRYVNAGHPPALLVRAGGTIERLEPGGPLIGVVPQAEFRAAEAALEPGAMLVIYSDGVTEAERPGGEMFEESRLVETLRRARDRDACAVQAAILAEVEAFTGRGEATDDVSLIVIRREGA